MTTDSSTILAFEANLGRVTTSQRIPLPADALAVSRTGRRSRLRWEWKIDGFRGVAFIENGRGRLVSRNGYTFTQWDALKREIAASVRCRSATWRVLWGRTRRAFPKLIFRLQVG